MKHHKLTKALKALPAVMMLGLFGGIALILFQHHTSGIGSKQDTIPPDRPLSQQFKIQGFHYSGYSDGKKVLSIKADQVIAEKQKLGFFRFGLVNVARIDNALIQIYGKEMSPEKSMEKSGFNFQESISFNDSFSRDTLPSFPIKQISSIVISPVVIELRDDTSVITRVSARSGVINVLKGSVILEGDIQVKSGDTILKADRIKLLPGETVLVTEGHYVLKTPQKEWEGQQLTTDIYLKPVSS